MTDQTIAAEQDIITELATVVDDYDHDRGLIAAGQFVLAHGALADLYDGAELRRMQVMSDPDECPWGVVGHWSLHRGDPNDQAPAGYSAHLETCPMCPYLEAVYEMHGDAGTCPDCGLENFEHTALPDDDGEPELWCPEPWERQEPTVGVVEDGVLHGQVGVAHDARWAAPLVDGTFGVISRTYFRTTDGGVTRVDEYTVCRDPEEVERTTLAYDGRDTLIDDFDPATETTQTLAEKASEPEPGEWAESRPGNAADLKLR